MPVQATLVSVNLTQGTYTQNGSLLSASLGTLSPLATASLVIVATPTLAGTMTNLTSIIASEFDPNLTNNVSLLLVPVETGTVRLTIQSELSQQAVTISWPASESDSQLESVLTLSPPLNWQVVTNPIVPVGNRLQVTVPIAENTRFFRLRVQ